MSGFIGWILTPEFRRHLLTYIPLDALLKTTTISKEFEETTREYIVRRVESGEMILHRGVDIVMDPANSSEEEKRAFGRATRKRNTLVTQVVFLQNVPRVGDFACLLAANLVVVDIPEGIMCIGYAAFGSCRSLTTVTFPATLTSIGEQTFNGCSSLENVDLLHTNLQELSRAAFANCSELKSVTIPDSLQTLGPHVFYACSKLVPSNIDVTNQTIDTTPEVVAHLRSEMSLNALLSGNNFLNTDDFRRLIVPYLSNDALITIRLASKPWSRVADEFIGDGVESGVMMVRDGRDFSYDEAQARQVRRKLVTRVIFLLHITKVGNYVFYEASNLVVVDIPEGVENIGESSFSCCSSLTTVSFPTTLTSIGYGAFNSCWSLENVDLLHTNLKKLGNGVFDSCSELKSMTIPDSLQTLGTDVFWHCSKLVPSNIDVNDWHNDTTPEVVAHLRSKQSAPCKTPKTPLKFS